MSATKIAPAFERWHQLWTARYPGDIPAADSDERHALKDRIAGMRAVCLPDTLAKVRLLLETDKGHGRPEDEMLASIAADLEQLASTISPALAELIDRWHAIVAERDRRLAEAKPRLAGADFETLDRETTAIIDPASDADAAVEMEIATYPAQSLADIAAKCTFSREEDPDNYDLAFAIVETTAEDAERLAGKGGAA